MAHGTSQAILGLGDGSDAPNGSPVATGANNTLAALVTANLDGSDITIDSASLIGTGTTLAAVLEELENGTVLDNTVIELTPGAAVAFDASLGHVATLAMSTDNTQTITISNLTAGQSVTVFATQNAAGSKALVFDGVFFAGGTEPTMTATAGAVDAYTIVMVGSQLYGFVAGQDLKT